MRSIFGPHICGDSLDVVGKEVLTGSWRPDKQLELWDFESGNKVADIPWNASSSASSPSCMLYAAQFSKEGDLKMIFISIYFSLGVFLCFPSRAIQYVAAIVLHRCRS